MSDVSMLNTLLTLEYELLATYVDSIGVLMAPATSDPNASVGPSAALIATHFRSQHQDHSVRLVALITSLLGTPVSQATVLYTPPVGFVFTVGNVIKLLANVEQAAAVAYTGALESLDLQIDAATAAAIGGVESQHFIWWYLFAQNLITFGSAGSLDANSLVPTSFTTTVGPGTTGLDTLPDFTYT